MSESVQGVTSSEAPSEVPVEAPKTGEASPALEEGENEVGVQLSPKTQERMRKLANEAREAAKYKTELQQLQEKFKQAEGALNIDKWLRADKKRADGFVQWMKQMENPQPQEDPYKDFDPDVAERFRKLDALEAWKQEQEQKSVIQYQSALDEFFESQLKANGYTPDEKGNYPEDVDLISNATFTELAKHGDPRLATKDQVKTAFDKVLSWTKLIEKRALKNTVKQPGVPASGTSSGRIPSQGVDLSIQENRIAALMAGMRG